MGCSVQGTNSRLQSLPTYSLYMRSFLARHWFLLVLALGVGLALLAPGGMHSVTDFWEVRRTVAVSLFLVNRRTLKPDDTADEASAFQSQLEVKSVESFVPRPNLRSLDSDDWDERVADLQYRDVCEFAVGHSISTAATVKDGTCRTLRTCWVPQAEVERVAPMSIPGVELSMDALGKLIDAKDAEAKLGLLVSQYVAWIDSQKG